MDKNNLILSKCEDDKLVSKIHERITASETHLSDWFKQAKEAYDFDIGHQWSDEDRAKLLEEGRPPVVFNRICRTINAICGLELQNRQEVNYLPRGEEDTEVSELLTLAAKWVRDNSDAEDEESDSFRDCLVSGVGVVETKVAYDVNPDGDIEVSRVDPFEYRVDPCASKRNFDDARWAARVKYLKPEEVKEKWPDVDLSIKLGRDSQFSGQEGSVHDSDPEMAYKQGTDNQDKEDLTEIIHYQWFERKPFYRVADIASGQVVELSSKKWEKVEKEPELLIQLGVDPANVRAVKQHKRQYWQATVCNGQLLEKEETPCDSFTYRAITGLRDRNKRLWYGVVWLMMDPQRWANKWLSQIQHILNSNAKGGIMVEDDATDDIQGLIDNWSKPNAVVKVNPGAIAQGKIQQIQAPRYPEGVDRMLQYAITGVSDAAGVSNEMLGLSDRYQAGYLEESRKKAGVTVLASFFDSLRRYRKEQGRLTASLIREYLNDGRLIRVIGEDNEKKALPLVFDKDTMKYDIVVDDAPTSTNTKDKVFSILSTLVPQLMQMGVPVPPDVLDYMPLPSSLKGKWKEYISEKSDPQQNQEADAMRQMQMQLAQLEMQNKAINNELDKQKVFETQTQAQLNQAKAQESLAVAADEAAQAQNKLGLDAEALAAKTQMEFQKAVAEQQRADYKMQADIDRENTKAALKQQNELINGAV